ncbi:MAG: putative metal-binding motif-containing protein [Pseudomonadota bacterium]
MTQVIVVPMAVLAALLVLACGTKDPVFLPGDTAEDVVVIEVIPETPETPPDTVEELPPPVICAPGEERCGEDGVETCNDPGTTWEPTQNCDSAELCLPDPYRCCLPDCVGKKCGPDGCGGSCGSCPQGLECNTVGKCQEICVPECDGKDCGPDGCEGVCGACGDGQECADGLCETICVPDCSDENTCGDDGCGGTCGGCGGDLSCQETLYGLHCSKACVDLGDCPTGTFCLGELCTPWECQEDGDCAPDEVCDPFLRCAQGLSCSGTDPCFPLNDPVTGGEVTQACDTDTATCFVEPEEVCVDGQCYPHAGACAWVTPGEGFCDDGEPCTIDSCDSILGCVHEKSDALACLDQVYTCEELHDMADWEASAQTAATNGAACEVHADCHLCLYMDGFDDGCATYLWFAAAVDVSLLLAVDQAFESLGCDPDPTCGSPPEPGAAPCCIDGACTFGGSCTAFVDTCLSYITCGALDTDGDGLGDGCDPDDDDDGFVDGEDCQPKDALAFPGAAERCNFADDDCDGDADEDFPEVGQSCVSQDPDACDPGGWWVCEEGTGLLLCQPMGWPGATEICDGKDNDCDAEVDEDGSVGCVACWEDLDEDDFGAGLPACVCAPNPQICFAQAPGDCDDEDPEAYPGQPELCNGKDDNCNGVTDEGCG